MKSAACIASRTTLLAAALAIAACGRSPAPQQSADSIQAAPVVADTSATPTMEPADPTVVHEAEVPYVATTSSSDCVAKPAATAEPKASEIHRWVDAAGVTHYSDRAPETAVSEHRVLTVDGLPPVRVEASGYDVNLPDDLARRAVADAVGVQRVFRDVLGVAAVPDLVLKAVFVRDEAAYVRLTGQGTLATSSGAYVPQQLTIYVRMQGDDEFAFSVLRHEMTHALIHEEIGNLPVALNEGLAEYFRRYRVAGTGGQIDLGADRRELAGAAPAGDAGDALVDLLALAGTDFYAADRERRYLRAYALAAVLMRGGEATAALRAVLAAQRAQPCIAIAPETVLADRYPGGLAGLAADWAAFLRDPPRSVRAY
ncbi:MAG TPA: DUF4124 domain-containing protein [Rhodanobacteraceae bacterium]|jgi:hypothetical protein|nr:DUF4124 domain-containing protein [Rhodanobacteraceae bacterium]